MKSAELFNEISKAQHDYANIFRKTVSASRRQLALDNHNLDKDDFTSEIIRESDLDHIGHLPLLATMIHPHLEHRDEVDLGKVLLYLALHEAPERIVGDVLHEDKNQDYNQAEIDAAQKIYSGDYGHYFDLYQDFHFLRNINAQFAYSIDRIGPIIFSNTKETIGALWKIYNIDVEKARASTDQYMQWDKTIYDLWNYILTTIVEEEK